MRSSVPQGLLLLWSPYWIILWWGFRIGLRRHYTCCQNKGKYILCWQSATDQCAWRVKICFNGFFLWQCQLLLFECRLLKISSSGCLAEQIKGCLCDSWWIQTASQVSHLPKLSLKLFHSSHSWVYVVCRCVSSKLQPPLCIVFTLPSWHGEYNNESAAIVHRFVHVLLLFRHVPLHCMLMPLGVLMH